MRELSLKARLLMEKRMSPWNLTMMFHLLVDHFADQCEEWGTVRDTWMFMYESFFGLLKKYARNRGAPVATIMRARQAAKAVNLVTALFKRKIASLHGEVVRYDLFLSTFTSSLNILVSRAYFHTFRRVSMCFCIFRILILYFTLDCVGMSSPPPRGIPTRHRKWPCLLRNHSRQRSLKGGCSSPSGSGCRWSTQINLPR
jgi:hypothetical protein